MKAEAGEGEVTPPPTSCTAGFSLTLLMFVLRLQILFSFSLFASTCFEASLTFRYARPMIGKERHHHHSKAHHAGAPCAYRTVRGRKDRVLRIEDIP
jgi:hypothetical protein